MAMTITNPTFIANQHKINILVQMGLIDGVNGDLKQVHDPQTRVHEMTFRLRYHGGAKGTVDIQFSESDNGISSSNTLREAVIQEVEELIPEEAKILIQRILDGKISLLISGYCFDGACYAPTPLKPDCTREEWVAYFQKWEENTRHSQGERQAKLLEILGQLGLVIVGGFDRFGTAVVRVYRDAIHYTVHETLGTRVELDHRMECNDKIQIYHAVMSSISKPVLAVAELIFDGVIKDFKFKYEQKGDPRALYRNTEFSLNGVTHRNSFKVGALGDSGKLTANIDRLFEAIFNLVKGLQDKSVQDKSTEVKPTETLQTETLQTETLQEPTASTPAPAPAPAWNRATKMLQIFKQMGVFEVADASYCNVFNALMLFKIDCNGRIITKPGATIRLDRLGDEKVFEWVVAQMNSAALTVANMICDGIIELQDITNAFMLKDNYVKRTIKFRINSTGEVHQVIQKLVNLRLGQNVWAVTNVTQSFTDVVAMVEAGSGVESQTPYSSEVLQEATISVSAPAPTRESEMLKIFKQMGVLEYVGDKIHVYNDRMGFQLAASNNQVITQPTARIHEKFVDIDQAFKFALSEMNGSALKMANMIYDGVIELISISHAYTPDVRCMERLINFRFVATGKIHRVIQKLEILGLYHSYWAFADVTQSFVDVVAKVAEEEAKVAALAEAKAKFAHAEAKLAEMEAEAKMEAEIRRGKMLKIFLQMGVLAYVGSHIRVYNSQMGFKLIAPDNQLVTQPIGRRYETIVNDDKTFEFVLSEMNSPALHVAKLIFNGVIELVNIGHTIISKDRYVVRFINFRFNATGKVYQVSQKLENLEPVATGWVQADVTKSFVDVVKTVLELQIASASTSASKPIPVTEPDPVPEPVPAKSLSALPLSVAGSRSAAPPSTNPAFTLGRSQHLTGVFEIIQATNLDNVLIQDEQGRWIKASHNQSLEFKCVIDAGETSGLGLPAGVVPKPQSGAGETSGENPWITAAFEFIKVYDPTKKYIVLADYGVGDLTHPAVTFYQNLLLLK